MIQVLSIILSFMISDAFVIYVKNGLHSNGLITFELCSDASINDLAQFIFEYATIDPHDTGNMLWKMDIRFIGTLLATFNLPIVHQKRVLLDTSGGQQLLSETGISSESVIEFEISQFIQFKSLISTWTSPMHSYHLKEERFEFEISRGEKDFFGSIKKQLNIKLGYPENTMVLFAITNLSGSPRSHRSCVLDVVRERRLWEFLVNGNVELIEDGHQDFIPDGSDESILEIQRHSGFQLAIIKQRVLLSQLMDNESAYFCEQANDYLNFWEQRKGTRVRFTMPSNFDLLFH